jgi:TPR repeat protein
LAAGCWSWSSSSSDWVDPLDPEQVIAEPRPAGEAEFLAGDHKAARGPLTTAAQGGSLRAAFFLRILVEHGLDGQKPDLEEAGRLVKQLASSESRLRGLAKRGPAADRPIYRAALATALLRGLIGSGPDPGAALGLARQAAEGGLLVANNLAAAAIMSPGVVGFPFAGILEGDHSEAWALTIKAAEAGDPLAMGNAGYLARRGIGISADILLGAAWTRRAADRPEAPGRALNDMGCYYEEGVAVTPDKAEALRWYGLAAARGFPGAAANLSRLKAGQAGTPGFFEGIEY